MYIKELDLHEGAEGPIQQSCIELSKISRLNKFLSVPSPRYYASAIGQVDYK